VLEPREVPGGNFFLGQVSYLTFPRFRPTIQSRVAVLEQTFRAGRETIHAVLLRQSSKLRWNAFLWGAGLRFANSFARRENAEKWLTDLLRRYFPSVDAEFVWGDPSPDSGRPAKPSQLFRELR
jgi:hypothetical protein